MERKQLVLQPHGEGTQIYEALGLSREEAQTVAEKLKEIASDDEEDHAKVIARVWNEIEGDAQCAFALYILGHHDERVVLGPLVAMLSAGMPESVED